MKRLILALLSLATPLLAVQVGDTAESVIAEKGKPTSTLKRGEITLFTYPDAKIQLKEGKVISVQAPAKDYVVKSAPATPAKPRTGQPGPSGGVQLPWTTDYANALATAASAKKKVFVFFTNSDSCGPCRQLEATMLNTTPFLLYAQSELVLVKIDISTDKPISSQLQEQYDELAKKYCVRSYPSIALLNSAGKEVARFGNQSGTPESFVETLKTF